MRKAKDIFKKPNSCGVCAGKIIVPGVNDALSNIPMIAEVWDFEKNEKLPQDFSKSSGANVWIICRVCNQSNLRKICNFSTGTKSCIVCCGKKVVPGVNDLASSHLYLEWSPNNCVDPTTITIKSGAEVLWLCALGHEYKMAPGTRTGQGQGCPYCSNQKVLKAYNDLSTTKPILLEHWDFEKNKESNLSPYEVTAGSNTKVWWTCKNSHSIFISPAQKWDSKKDRVRICRDCLRGISSYGEEELFNFLKDNGNDVISSARGELDRGEIDCYIPKLKLGIEFNGDYWHSDQVVFGKHSITAEEYHRRKLDSATENGITLLFIWASDWYSDTEVIKKILLQTIFEIRNTGDVDPDSIDPIFKILTKNDFRTGIY